jgi:hypothetical protein
MSEKQYGDLEARRGKKRSIKRRIERETEHNIPALAPRSVSRPAPQVEERQQITRRPKRSFLEVSDKTQLQSAGTPDASRLGYELSTPRTESTIHLSSYENAGTESAARRAR